MRGIVEHLRRPFVLHLWDLLDGLDPTGSDDLAWLVGHAACVFVLTPAMAERIGSETRSLLFSRDDTELRASQPARGAPVNIALVGDILSYLDGMAEIKSADRRLRADDIQVRWIYLGPKVMSSRLPPDIRSLLNIVGFLESAADRDRTLAECQFAFLPGPRRPGSESNRSRYSVPSRVLDYTAIGLPIIGVVDPDTATAKFLTELGDQICNADGAQLAACIEKLLDPAAWTAGSRASRALFERVLAEDPVGTLARQLGC